jgi:hypothetical protein
MRGSIRGGSKTCARIVMADPEIVASTPTGDPQSP